MLSFIYTFRLVNPDNESSFGRVEVHYGVQGVQFVGTLGTYKMLMWFFISLDTMELCQPLEMQHLGQGTGPIWLNRVQCGVYGQVTTVGMTRMLI